MPAFAAQPTRSGKEKAMKSKQVHSTLILFSLLTILVAAGCSPNENQAPPTEPAAAENPSPPPAVIEETSTPVDVHENEPVVDENILLQDDFTNPTTGWPEEKFDNYFIGYHEPEYYHVEITSPNYRTVVFEPEKRNFSDVTIEVKVFAVGSRTAPDGDLSFGLAFRRSGDQYYAFTISPRTKKWYVLKSTPNALIVLSEGSEEGIHDLDGEDILRVDAQGSDFSFHINDRLVAQITDPDFVSGEVGLYAQTFDAANTHIHFDNLIVRNFEAPLVCTVKAMTLNVRNGPGTDFASSSFLTRDDIVQPLAISPDGEWIKITLEGSEGQGWVFNSEGFLSCSSDISQLPTAEP
jgi:hypothetical protein